MQRHVKIQPRDREFGSGHLLLQALDCPEEVEVDLGGNTAVDTSCAADLTGKTGRYALLKGSMLRCPLFEFSHGAKNWCAIVTGIDPSVPGGMTRVFVPRAGEVSYRLDSPVDPEKNPLPVKVGDILEFGADSVTMVETIDMYGDRVQSPHRARNRVFALVTALNMNKFVEFQFFATVRQAATVQLQWYQEQKKKGAYTAVEQRADALEL